MKLRYFKINTVMKERNASQWFQKFYILLKQYNRQKNLCLCMNDLMYYFVDIDVDEHPVDEHVESFMKWKKNAS